MATVESAAIKVVALGKSRDSAGLEAPKVFIADRKDPKYVIEISYVI